MTATIMDVARRAGVSMKTVSRVMNNEPSVSDTTREKVNHAALELNYTPNRAARGLASSKSFLIAMLYDIPSPGYTINLQKGATEACREHGYHLIVEPLDTNVEDVAKEITGLITRLSVDGIILAPPICDNAAVIQLLAKKNTPYIPIAPSANHGDIPYVVMDDSRAAKEMTKHLIDLGHTEIGFVKGHPRHSASSLRFQGYREAMRAADLTINPDWIADGEFTYKSGVEAGKAILNAKKRPSAIFASNDDSAAGVMAAAAALGISVPTDLSVAGFDDTTIASSVWPPLTTIRQPVVDMGYKAAKLLLVKDDVEPGKNIMQHALIERGSTQAV